MIYSSLKILSNNCSFPCVCLRSDTPLRLATSKSDFFDKGEASFRNKSMNSNFISRKQQFSCKSTYSSRFESPGVSSSNLESWLHEAVVEIIRHLREAPFLHLVFDQRQTRLSKRHKVSTSFFDDPDSWSSIKDTVLQSSPDGFILVQRLSSKDLLKCYGQECLGISMSDSDFLEPSQQTDVWGLVVQSRGQKRHSCYILKTTRVNSLSGSCTKFSLTKAKCFGPSLHKQLENSWLVH